MSNNFEISNERNMRNLSIIKDLIAKGVIYERDGAYVYDWQLTKKWKAETFKIESNEILEIMEQSINSIKETIIREFNEDLKIIKLLKQKYENKKQTFK